MSEKFRLRTAWFILILLLAHYCRTLFGGILSDLWISRWHLDWPWPPQEFPLIFFLPYHLGLVALLFLTCGGLGRLMSPLRTTGHFPVSFIFFEILLGYAFFSYLIWFLGLLGLCGRLPVLIFSSFIILITAKSAIKFFFDVKSVLDEFHNEAIAGQPDATIITPKNFFIAASCLLFIQLIAAHAPSVFRDDLSYHLYLPKAYLEMGAIEPPPYPQMQSFYHQIFNMPLIPLMAAGGELAAKMINPAWSIIIAALAAFLARSWAPSGLNRRHQITLACFLAVWMLPMLQSASSSATTDLAAASFSMGGLLALFMAKNIASNESSLGLAFMGLALSALALNKYTSLAFAVANVALFLWFHRGRRAQMFQGLIFFTVVSLGAMAPLAAYLWEHTGNPLYPMSIGGIFTSNPIEETFQASARLGASPAKFLAYLWNHILGGRFLEMSLCGVLVLGGMILPGALSKPIRLGLLWIGLGLGAAFFFLGESGLIARYVLPAYAALSVIAIIIFDGWSRRSSDRVGKKLFLIIFWLGIISPGLFSSALNFFPQLQLNLGLATQYSYLEKYYPSEGWVMVNAVNALPPSRRTAVLDHHFTPYHYRALGGDLWPVPYENLIETNPEKIKKILAEHSITHVLMVSSQWQAQKTPSGVSFRAPFFGPRLQCRWWEKGILPFLKPALQTSGAVLFEIKN
ncbi:MAG: hypothetical protein HY547_08095 [Elusimicrobia bacterium]|nr:hypothetical protein [Elusimicrobiota bacterium]